MGFKRGPGCETVTVIAYRPGLVGFLWNVRAASVVARRRWADALRLDANFLGPHVPHSGRLRITRQPPPQTRHGDRHQ
jgi:hypothetical protein